MQSAAKGGSVRQSAETATVLQRVATNVGNNVGTMLRTAVVSARDISQNDKL